LTRYIDGYVCAFGNQHACFESSLTVSDWASWVQAIGAIAAIVVAFVVGNRQSRAQAAAARAMLAEQSWQAARTVKQFASSAQSAINYVSVHLATREHVHTVATEGFGSTMAELDAMEKMLASVPVYQFRAELAQCLLLIAGTIRQFRMKVANTIDWHRGMDAAAFADFFQTVEDIKRSMADTAADVDKLVERFHSETLSA